MQIGRHHAKQMEKLRAVFAELKSASPPEFAAGFQDLVDRVDGWTARIAAVGQVKAGKSTILSTLIGEAGFLPSDVNPWTSVVTNIRINVPGDPKSGASFEFFDESSWDRIINGDPEMRKLAQEMLPGFDAEILRKQTEEMRNRAQRRLGRYYSTLLGKKHEYDILSADLLERYVCAGPGADEGLEREAVGRYAAITKVANVFRSSPEFAVPSIITDTPGVNDPFLVRDEFTCQSLGDSDIFIIMLSAHQALTEVDVALCRMLAAQQHKDVIIFINRIDELEDVAGEVERVVADVSNRIFEAIPDREFTVLCGSAYWAELAMSKDADAAALRAVANDPSFVAFLEKTHGKVPNDPRARLLRASGLPDLKRSLSESMDFGVGAGFLADLVEMARAQVAALKSVTQRRLARLHEQIESYGQGDLGAFEETVSEELHDLGAVHAEITGIIEAAEADFDVTMTDGWTALQQRLDRHVAEFADGHRARLVEELADVAPDSSALYEVNILPLRSAIEDEVRARYQTERRRLDGLLGDALDRANAAVTRVLDGAEIQMSLAGMPGEEVMAAFSTSRKSFTVGLAMKSSWAFWRRKSIDFDETLAALRRVTAAEVHPSTVKMIETFTTTLASRADAGKERLRLVLGIVERSLEDRHEKLEENRRLMAGSEDGSAAERLLTRLQSDSEILDSSLRLIAMKESQLSREATATAA